jgi:A/G-specific adenine glycosylase
MTSSIANSLLEWYKFNARRLPWREQPDPYRVWIAEVMLQQTRVETVLPYYERWIQRFPTIASLASASLQEVLVLWEGLGYYQRARNLHKATQIIITKFNGEIPDDPKTLGSLPGIGKYTAAAIASIAFGWDVPVLDGNVRRVLSRLFDVRLSVSSGQGEKLLSKLAASHLPPGRAGEYNQALMDLGATICTPHLPSCLQCPLGKQCKAQALGVQGERPIMEKRKNTPHYTVTAAVIQRNGCVLIAQRPFDGLLGGLWEFPGGKVQPGEDLFTCLIREIREEMDVKISVGEALGIHRHAYTHFKVTLHAFRCNLLSGEPRNLVHNTIIWARLNELTSYPMGKIDRQIAKKICS